MSATLTENRAVFRYLLIVEYVNSSGCGFMKLQFCCFNKVVYTLIVWVSADYAISASRSPLSKALLVLEDEYYTYLTQFYEQTVLKNSR